MFPSTYSACDGGDGEACSRLAFELAAWSDSQRAPLVTQLHRLACDADVRASCVELLRSDLLRRSPSAAQQLSEHCQAKQPSLRACEALSDAGDLPSAKRACELGSERGCDQLNSLWRGRRDGDTALSFFVNLCVTEARGQACRFAAEWISAQQVNDETERESPHLRWLAKACEARDLAGCFRLDAELVEGAARGDITASCSDLARGLAGACEHASLCRAFGYCRALAGDPRAIGLLERACRADPASTDCSLLLAVPGAVPRPSPP